MTVRNRTRLLGFYLLLCVTYQVAIYLWPNFFPDPKNIDIKYFNTSWFHFANPRVGLFFFLMSDQAAQLWYLISASWLFVFAVALVAIPDKPIVAQLYVVTEMTMSLASILYFCGAVLFGFNAELMTQIAVFIAFSMVPSLFAMTVLREAKLALKLIATFVLSLLACPVAFLLFGVVNLFTRDASGWNWTPLYAALILPVVVLIVGIGWSFTGTKRAAGNSNSDDSA